MLLFNEKTRKGRDREKGPSIKYVGNLEGIGRRRGQSFLEFTMENKSNILQTWGDGCQKIRKIANVFYGCPKARK